MTNVYLNLPDFYEFATLKRWGDPYADSGWGYLNNKGIETPDGKYFCAIVSIRETSNSVYQGFFSLHENKPPYRLILEYTRRAIFADLPIFSPDGKIMLHAVLAHRFSGSPIGSYIVIDPQNRSFALIPFLDEKKRNFYCTLEHIKDSKYRISQSKVKFDLNKLTYYPLEKLNEFEDVEIPRFRFGAVEPVPVFLKRQPSVIGYLHWQHKRHPSLTVTDIIKQCYQAAYGAEHLLTDKDVAKKFLEKEFENTPAEDILICEHISEDLCRVNIAAWKHRGLPAEDLFELFAASAYPRENGKDMLERYLREAEEYIDAHEVTEVREDSEKNRTFKRVNIFCENGSEIIEEYRRSGMPPIHHSDVYREAEHPAYRVVDSKLLRDYFENRNYKKDVSL